jgi:hypothetical protein
MSKETNYERWSLGVEIAGFLVVVISIWFLFLQTRSQNESLKAQNKSLISSSYSAVMDEQLELTGIFLENPALGPYFMDDESTDVLINLEDLKSSNPELYYQVISAADIHLDFFDLVFGQSGYFLEYEEGVFDEAAWVTWQQYIKDTFAQSPVLCQRLEQVQKWYKNDYIAFSGCSFARTE